MPKVAVLSCELPGVWSRYFDPDQDEVGALLLRATAIDPGGKVGRSGESLGYNT